MVFSTPTFLVFFAVLMLLYAGTQSYRQRAGLLLAASLIFYASWKPSYLILLGLSVGINYLIYLRLQETRAKPWLVLGLVLNLALLGTIKYLAMMFETVFSIAAWWGVSWSGTTPSWMDWALPLGISFYTFHMLSVMVDVYRGEWTHRISFRIWCLYVTFFPHMIAGPILRASELIGQLEQLKPLSPADVRLGGLIFLAGLVKKILLADNLAGVADTLYAQPEALGFATAWLATVAFALQIYFDFSGYSEMAIGLALMFGVTLPRNFLHPYISRNPQEFWRRWHITLSRWLRDYLYISLGGSRGTVVATYRNLLLTMMLGGLWHGASWTFVFWGALHGIYLIGHRLLMGVYEYFGVDRQEGLKRILSAIGLPVTFLLICFTWVFFRASNFSDAWLISQTMLGLGSTTGAEPMIRSYVVILTAAALVFAFLEPWLERKASASLISWWETHWTIRGVSYAMVGIVLIFFGGSSQKFIYFDF
jgi:alginate O-acetyltransferase complex protein AlgI